MMKKLTAPITIALIFLTGCAGHNFNENNVLNLQAGITTPNEQRSYLGKSMIVIVMTKAIILLGCTLPHQVVQHLM